MPPGPPPGMPMRMPYPPGPMMTMPGQYPPPPPPPIPSSGQYGRGIMPTGPPPLGSQASMSQIRGYSSQPPAPPPPMPQSSAQLSAAPSRPTTEGATTIEAKPVLRNKMAELTRFVPSTLMVRRDQNKSRPQYQHQTKGNSKKKNKYYSLNLFILLLIIFFSNSRSIFGLFTSINIEPTSLSVKECRTNAKTGETFN